MVFTFVIHDAGTIENALPIFPKFLFLLIKDFVLQLRSYEKTGLTKLLAKKTRKHVFCFIKVNHWTNYWFSVCSLYYIWSKRRRVDANKNPVFITVFNYIKKIENINSHVEFLSNNEKSFEKLIKRHSTRSKQRRPEGTYLVPNDWLFFAVSLQRLKKKERDEMKKERHPKSGSSFKLAPQWLRARKPTMPAAHRLRLHFASASSWRICFLIIASKK